MLWETNVLTKKTTTLPQRAAPADKQTYKVGVRVLDCVGLVYF